MRVDIDKIYNMIVEADRVLEGKVYRTPVDKSHALSRLTGGEVYLKLENLQRTGAFKIRGAYYTLWRTIREGRVRTCVTASSGNHAQGVALAASELGVRAVIVMPETTPRIKVKATRDYGAEVVLHGRTYDDAYERALKIREELGAEFVHPFNDERVVAGQGTIGLEICRALGRVDVVLVPVGGGGLISGIAIAMKRLVPKAKVIGVQPEGAPAMTLSYREGRLVEYSDVDTIADGVVVKRPGDLTLSIIRELVDDMVLVSDDDIIRAMLLLLERSKCVAEPAGALGVAALLSGKVDVSGKRAVVVVSGGNVDMTLLARVIEKALVLEGRQVRVVGVVPDVPGTLKEVLDVIADLGANVVDIRHDRADPSLRPGKARVAITMELPEGVSAGDVVERLRERGYAFEPVWA